MQKKIWIVLSVLFVVAVILIFFSKLPVVSSIEGFIQDLFATPQKTLYSFMVNSHHDESSQIQKLKNENRDLTGQLVDIDTLKKDNFALRSQLADTPVSMHHLIQAHVVGFSGDPHFPDTLVIDQGETTGIKKNMTVIYSKNLVGVIDSVLKNYSVVSLVNRKNFSFLGKTVQNSTLGIVQGEGSFIRFNQVVITDPLHVNDVVVTRGEVGNNGIGVLPNLVVGKVVSITHVPSDSFQSAKLETMVDFTKLTTLFVIAQ
jgi:rod shape-determining protein MreC